MEITAHIAANLDAWMAETSLTKCIDIDLRKNRLLLALEMFQPKKLGRPVRRNHSGRSCSADRAPLSSGIFFNRMNPFTG